MFTGADCEAAVGEAASRGPGLFCDWWRKGVVDWIVLYLVS